MTVNATIGECIANGFSITAWCPAGHSRVLDLAMLRDRLGEDHSALRDALLPKLRCSTCGAKAQSIICSPAGGAKGWPGG